MHNQILDKQSKSDGFQEGTASQQWTKLVFPFCPFGKFDCTPIMLSWKLWDYLSAYLQLLGEGNLIDKKY